MTQEAYVSFEVSKLLKEKGFDEPTTHWYNVRERLINDYQVTYKNFGNPEKVWLAPTHQMACAWLREHNLMNLDIRGYGVFEYDTQERTSVFAYDVEVVYMRDMTLLASFYGAKSYEEAVEWGLIHALQWNSEHIDKRQQL